ncbi:hypothetical protein NCS57_01175900 [Fusarium keratoplasticum]|uniref:Uncharacterized protein n=1 Tax=Fusarium keratoplasticum TaxID=1328300 RepID=A0ACC0QLP9_9HYPO|nr:hypothetical protein NCS57_01175900 [Fusarium keratoplasticum]KAI8657957.1 hypothetical protein NCS57_01175900 [Fusarium keratoplasticum]
MQGKLDGKVAVVTGASSGMGRAIAIALAGEGAKIALCDLQEKANAQGYEADVDKTTGDIIAAQGGDSIFLQTDIASSTAVQETFSRALERFGRIDILINCAGYWAPFCSFADESEELWAKMAAVNTLGTARMSRSAIRQFLKQELDEKWGSRGRIVNISSCASVTGFPGEVAYSATKASVDHMTRAGALDHAKDSININCVAPGVVATGMARGNLENSSIHQTMVKATPWPRLGTVDDIAAAVLFLCLPQSQWITGQVLPVDGGMTIGVSP